MQETDELQAVIAAMWANARPRLLARVEALEAAVAADLRDPERETALLQAHTLVGTLGTFGRPVASDSARAAEVALEAGDRDAVCAAVEKLRAQIEAD
ncbi:Hpt domain-containing protein [Solirubrobacter sp. CPCC 204708]|uniref:Hpt domain-containing protein n=1 Tax=Solirubrobacter deserti TaxID=2282478 RepID=A0ABT4RLF0_9ACTN|nr:Hpt domain-containing protein [Solirubrobacter deserti]MBE2318965.1 Hpt domain-containing protein [Solirubrobacter deserti]MDA0139310.1 Hpt domain-containing protein [Solirubrobacter deserti]